MAKPGKLRTDVERAVWTSAYQAARQTLDASQAATIADDAVMRLRADRVIAAADALSEAATSQRAATRAGSPLGGGGFDK